MKNKPERARCDHRTSQEQTTFIYLCFPLYAHLFLEPPLSTQYTYLVYIVVCVDTRSIP